MGLWQLYKHKAHTCSFSTILGTLLLPLPEDFCFSARRMEYLNLVSFPAPLHPAPTTSKGPQIVQGQHHPPHTRNAPCYWPRHRDPALSR